MLAAAGTLLCTTMRQPLRAKASVQFRSPFQCATTIVFRGDAAPARAAAAGAVVRSDGAPPQFDVSKKKIARPASRSSCDDDNDDNNGGDGGGMLMARHRKHFHLT